MLVPAVGDALPQVHNIEFRTYFLVYHCMCQELISQ